MQQWKHSFQLISSVFHIIRRFHSQQPQPSVTGICKLVFAADVVYDPKRGQSPCNSKVQKFIDVMWQWKDVDALFSLLSASLKRLFHRAGSKLKRDACQRQASGVSQTNFLKLAQRMEAHSVGANRQIILSEDPPPPPPNNHPERSGHTNWTPHPRHGPPSLCLIRSRTETPAVVPEQTPKTGNVVGEQSPEQLSQRTMSSP